MLYFDRHPNQFRLLFGILAGYLLLLAGVTFYQIATRPTDENLFTNPQSNLYVTQQIPSTLVSGKKGPSDNEIQPGDLITGVEKMSVVDRDDLKRELARAPDSTSEITVARYKVGEKKTYRVVKSRLDETTVRDIGPTARVISVTPGGASDRAGMFVGDLILRINGKSFKNSTDADRILAEGQVGKDLVYDVLRDNEVLSLHVIIAAIGIAFPVLVSTLTGLAFFAMGIFLGLVRSRYIAARLSGLSFIAFGYFIVVLLIRPAYVVSTFEVVRNITMALVLYFAIPLSIHAGHYFPAERPELLARKWVRWVPYGIAIVGIAVALLVGNAAFFGTLVVLVLYAVAIIVVFRKQASEEFKRLNMVVRNASLIAAAGSFLCAVYLLYTFQQQDIGYMTFPLILIPLGHLYTIGRYRLMGLDLRVRRNVQYILVTSAWMVVLGLVAFRILFWLQGAQLPIPNIHLTSTSVEVLDSPLRPEQRIWLEKGILMLLSVLVVFGGWKIARRGRNLIDKLYYRSRYDYRLAANELAEVMATKLSMVELAQGMVEKLSGLLQLKRVGVLFFRDQSVSCCQEVHGFDGSSWGEFCIRHDQELTEALQELQIESNVDALPEDIRNEFRKNGFLYVATIRSKDKLVGALLVGEKRSEATFQQEDLDFLGVVAKQASVAIENAFLYEELAQQERMKHELAIARRIQLASLPQTTPTIDGLDIAGASHPALEVGGDYFDYLNGEADSITIIVGDVSGKGTSAALYMSKVQGILRSLNAFKLSPKELFVRTNKLLCHDLEKSSFVTAITGAFEPRKRKLVVARAGHLPLYHFVALTRKVEIVTPKGLGLGLESTDLFAAELEERVILYQPNDVFVLASDGVTEAEDISGAQLGEDGLIGLIAQHADKDAVGILNEIMNATREFGKGGEQHDDQTMVIVKVR
ncbi:MAG: SpoIIE family protein phosphatase [Ignavibacteriales bacterium]|nr:SpoIIE family protein phosphatase [Ignavibacteriales bacterium]